MKKMMIKMQIQMIYFLHFLRIQFNQAAQMPMKKI